MEESDDIEYTSFRQNAQDIRWYHRKEELVYADRVLDKAPGQKAFHTV